MIERDYDRSAVFNYAKKWAFGRNPEYYSFNKLGGDCTNFASQCIYAGARVMNFTPVYGWYYIDSQDRTTSWTGVEFLYNFLLGNKGGAGPYAEETDIAGLEVGDIVQFGREDGTFYHTPVVVGFSRGEPLLAAHSYDVFNKPLSSYRFARLRCLHIAGVRACEGL